jgi:acetoin utilization protein AcuB
MTGRALRVRDCMSTPVRVIGPEAPVWEAVALMRRYGIRRLPVVEGDALVGIVTWTDAMRVYPPAPPGQSPAPRPVGLLVRHLMTAAPRVVAPDDDLGHAARLMRAHKIGGLPVVDGGRLVGILTESDLFDAFVDALARGRTAGSPEPGREEGVTMRMLVAVDLSPASDAVVDYAVRLAAQTGARLTVFHAYTAADVAEAQQRGVYADQFVESLRSDIAYLLERAGADARQVTIAIAMGPPVEAILRAAADARADLIVVGTHGRSGLDRLLIGSVAEGVLRRAPCPVVVLPYAVAAGAGRTVAARA